MVASVKLDLRVRQGGMKYFASWEPYHQKSILVTRNQFQSEELFSLVQTQAEASDHR